MTDCVDEASVRQILLKAKPDAFVSMMQDLSGLSYLSIYQTIYPSIYLSFYLSIYLSIITN